MKPDAIGVTRRVQSWRGWRIACAIGLMAAFATPGLADKYPDRSIRLIVPLPPGGAVDITARLLQPLLEKSLGQSIVIDNRPGASGIIGANVVATAPPDGYTLLMVPTTFTINPATNANMPFDPLKAFEPVAVIGRNSLLFLANPTVEANSLPDFVKLAKANSGKLNYATPGASSQAHLLIEQWSAQAGVKLQHVPYRGGAPAVRAVVANEAQLTLISPLASLPQIEAKKLKALATGGPTREPQLSNVQTAAEAGFPKFAGLQWIGLLTTGGTPKPIVKRLNAEINRALKDKTLQAKFAEQCMSTAGGSADEFRTLIAAEITQWTEVGRMAHIKVK